MSWALYLLATSAIVPTAARGRTTGGCTGHSDGLFPFRGAYPSAPLTLQSAKKSEKDSAFASRTSGGRLAGRRRWDRRAARSEAEEVFRIDPKFSLQRFGKMLPFKNQAERNRIVAALRKAGLK